MPSTPSCSSEPGKSNGSGGAVGPPRSARWKSGRPSYARCTWGHCGSSKVQFTYQAAAVEVRCKLPEGQPRVPPIGLLPRSNQAAAERARSVIATAFSALETAVTTRAQARHR